MLLALLLLVVFLCFGEESIKSPWSVHLELSFVNTSGNTSTSTLSEKLEIERSEEKNRLFFKNSFLYSKRNNRETANRLELSSRLERLITSKLFIFMSGSYERDKFSGYDYKWSAGGGLGYDLIKSPLQELKVLVSFPYYYNRIREGGVDNYATFKSELFYRRKLLSNLKFKEEINYILNLSDTRFFFVNSETSLEVSITDNLSLGVSYKIYYQNKPPAPEVKRLDTVFATSLIFNL